MPILKNQRHEKAVQAYLSNGGNQSAAYRVGYPSSLKWKERSVWNKANKLFKRDDVAARVRELQERLEKKEVITKEKMLERLEAISRVRITDYIESVDFKTSTVIYKKIEDWTEEMKEACDSFKPGRYGIELTVYGIEYPFSRIAKMLGYDAPVKTITAETTLADLLKVD